MKLLVDAEGNLGDEDDDPDTNLGAFFGYDPSTANIFGGTGEFAANNTAFVIRPNVSLPIGPSLTPLHDRAGCATSTAQIGRCRRIVFSYRLSCGEGGDRPLPEWVLSSSPTSRCRSRRRSSSSRASRRRPRPPAVRRRSCWWTSSTGRNPNAIRRATQAGPVPLPAEECVVPSTKAGTEDEWPDFVPNPRPPRWL
ncbi:MAG: hypothetical protein U0271_11130 [Polyangiaceae bacterium]